MLQSGRHPKPTQPAMDLLRDAARLVDEYLAAALKRPADAPPRLIEAMGYSLQAGGKRLRPALVIESFRACVKLVSQSTGDRSAPTAPGAANSAVSRSALCAAGAIELIHTFSLVHDDLPAMDNDDLRRGRPTNHKVFGEAMAILAGDAMTALAFELIATDAAPELAAPLVRELAQAAGAGGMIGGQVLDMEGENRSLDFEQLTSLHRMKTGALLTCACRMGAIAAGADEHQLSSLTTFGRHLGLAFQIIDDVLDVTATPEQLGKHTNKDAGRGKNTYPALLGLDPARAAADRELSAALQALQPLGNRGSGLQTLAEFVVRRES